MRQINIAHAAAIISIEFICETNGTPQSSGVWGGKSNQIAKVIFGNNEFLTSMKGTYGSFNGNVVVTSLEFISDGGSSKGIFGQLTSNPFSVSLSSGKIIGFHGSSGDYLHSIGVYLKQEVIPLHNSPRGLLSRLFFTDTEHEQVIPITIEPWGTSGGTVQENSTIEINGSTRLTKIYVTHGGVVDSLAYVCETDGIPYSSGLLGGIGGLPNEVAFENGEYLTAIKGTTGLLGQVPYITSIEFATNLSRIIGPFGWRTGTPFSFSVSNGQIVGFNGRYNLSLKAVGVIVIAAPKEKKLSKIVSFLNSNWKIVGGATLTFTAGVYTTVASPILFDIIGKYLKRVLCDNFHICL